MKRAAPGGLSKSELVWEQAKVGDCEKNKCIDIDFQQPVKTVRDQAPSIGHMLRCERAACVDVYYSDWCSDMRECFLRNGSSVETEEVEDSCW